MPTKIDASSITIENVDCSNLDVNNITLHGNIYDVSNILQIQREILDISNNFLLLNANTNGGPDIDAGILIRRNRDVADSSYCSFIAWDEPSGRFKLGEGNLYKGQDASGAIKIDDAGLQEFASLSVQDISCNGNLDVDGNVDISGNLDVNGNVNVSENLDISGILDVSGLNVINKSTFKGDVSMNTLDISNILIIPNSAKINQGVIGQIYYNTEDNKYYGYKSDDNIFASLGGGGGGGGGSATSDKGVVGIKCIDTSGSITSTISFLLDASGDTTIDQLDTEIIENATATLQKVKKLYDLIDWEEPVDGSNNRFTFTNCDKYGSEGPTITDCSTVYGSSIPPGEYFDVSHGIQLWTVPYTATYEIEAWGANGGDSTDTHGNDASGGNGAYIKGYIELEKNDIINILIGQKGSNGQFKWWWWRRWYFYMEKRF